MKKIRIQIQIGKAKWNTTRILIMKKFTDWVIICGQKSGPDLIPEVGEN